MRAAVLCTGHLRPFAWNAELASRQIVPGAPDGRARLPRACQLLYREHESRFASFRQPLSQSKLCNLPLLFSGFLELQRRFIVEPAPEIFQNFRRGLSRGANDEDTPEFALIFAIRCGQRQLDGI